MSNNPFNLLLRFLLELAALAAMSAWGYQGYQGWLRWLVAIGVPFVAAAAWGIFRVPNDGGKPVVTVPGWTRLALEAVFFSGASAALFCAHWRLIGWIFTAIVVAHYAISYDRIARILARPSPPIS